MRRPARIALAAVAVLGIAAAGAYGFYEVTRARCYVPAGHVTCRVETPAKAVALTFDDGPTALGLDSVLRELEAHGAHATFFLIGAEAQKHPEMVRRLLDAGHEVGNHSWSHVRMVGRSRGFYDAELSRTDAALRSAGAEPKLFRPPYGKKFVGLPLAVERAGLTMVTWDVEDPKTQDPQAFARQVVAEARPGSIILVHPMYRANAAGRAALPLILDGLAAEGLKVVTVSELLARAAP